MDNFRKSLRLTGFDYSSSGCYFVTICTQGKKCILSDVLPGTERARAQVQLTELGRIVSERLQEEAKRCNMRLLKWAIMPNHVHLLLENCGTIALGRYVGAVKSTTVYQLRCRGRKISSEKLWQRNYYDHVIRNQEDFDEKWKYIDENPDKWARGEYD